MVVPFILHLLSPDLLYMVTAAASESPGIIVAVFSGIVKVN